MILVSLVQVLVLVQFLVFNDIIEEVVAAGIWKIWAFLP